MVSLEAVKASNARLLEFLPPNLVAVFVGGTSGIGEFTLRKFAQYAKRPKAYLVGRSQAAADRIILDLKKLNPEGEYFFIAADVSLIKNVDTVCDEIKRREKSINILFLSCGGMLQDIETSEGLHSLAALNVYSRIRFILNLLPLLQAAISLRRVVTVMVGANEGPVNLANLQFRNTTVSQIRGHAATMKTLLLEIIANKAPEVSFVHDYPGGVKSGLMRDAKGIKMAVVKLLMTLAAPFIFIPADEVGERHLFLATSARYPAAEGDAKDALFMGSGGTARGSDGREGSGVYSVDQHCESAKLEKEEFLKGLRGKGTSANIWEQVRQEFERITGKPESG